MALFFIIPVLVLFYGGGFVLPFTYCRFRKHHSLGHCLTSGFLGLIIFFFVVTAIADVGAALIHFQSLLLMGGMIAFLALPYVLSGWIMFQYRRKKNNGSRSDI
jgi:hypothetical protein